MEEGTLPEIVRFGIFEVDFRTREIRKRGLKVRLHSQPFKVLAALLENPGEVVTRQELHQRIWPGDTFVDFDNGLNGAINRLREVLGDSAASPRFVETMPRQGYRFIAPVVQNTPPVTGDLPGAGEGQTQARLNDPPLLAISSSNPVIARDDRRPPAMNSVKWFVLLGVAVFFAGGLTWELRNRSDHRKESTQGPEHTYTQITNFTDSAVAPALSPDGRMVAFYRSDSAFLTPDQIYVKWLPQGEPVQLTNDPSLKYGLAFSPDGSRLAYATYNAETDEWKTFTVPPLGGEPTLLLSNAAGLSWLDQHRVLFSEIDIAPHMGIVTATESRSDYHKLYSPQHQRMMAHFSYPSPDRQWALVAEMDPVWQPCRLISLNGSSVSRQVGPQGQCTAAAWSPDGKWMYFGAEVEGSHHLWRQRFAGGEPKQFTYGPTEEDGLAMAPDGRSIITSIGLHETALWMHNKRGDRALSSEGYVNPSSARFSSDGKLLFYLLRRDSSSSSSELWRRDLGSGKSQPVLPGISMLEYDISSDAKEAVYSTQPPGKPSQLWLAYVDGSAPPRLIGSGGERAPHFGPDARVVFQFTDGKANYIGQIKKDGSEFSRLLPYPVSALVAISPDRRWMVVDAPFPNDDSIRAIQIRGGSSRRICTWCSAAWAPDGKFFYVGLGPNARTNRGKTLAIPVPAGGAFPKLPYSGIREPEDAKAIPGTRLLDGWFISPGLDPSTFAYVKTTMHRNLYRIPVP